LMENVATSPAPRVVVRTQRSVPADDAGEVANAIVRGLVRRRRESPGSEQSIVLGEVCAPGRALFSPYDVLPPPSTQQPMVSARHERRSVVECDSVRSERFRKDSPRPAAPRVASFGRLR
jgi:hypothetical protein